MHTLLTEQSLGARLANTFLASAETLGCPIAYNPQVRWPESEGRMDYRDEKRRVISILIFWAIWAVAVILAYYEFF
jgi:hypothetical protein